ncbi:hypothetical protein SORBI_3003G139050 [Sorghum bicolor]|uniref:Reverse transcriptase zinc-binding domain-containing protein n=1 Tax=Sorghum bicolor TaxID=4558 RepID=A0A1B6Q325_SORBI|nr:hypothetical protein SORBI_3003G139050 [Sorghum bicolor]
MPYTGSLTKRQGAVVKGRIQCRANLFKKHMVDSSAYVSCGAMEAETPEHLLFFCDKASQFWNSIGVHLPQTGISTRDIHSFLKISAVPTLQHNMFVAFYCWQLWKCRNAFIFLNETMTLRQLLLSCAAEELEGKDVKEAKANSRKMVQAV